MKILVTGAAGFIGAFTARVLLERGETVVGLDNFNDYYDVSLKEARAALLEPYKNFSMVRIGLQDRAAMEKLFADDSVELAPPKAIGKEFEQSASMGVAKSKRTT